MRRKRIAFEQLEEILQMLEQMPIDIDPARSNRLFTVASSGSQARVDDLRCRVSEFGAAREAPSGDCRRSLEKGALAEGVVLI